MSDDHDAVEAVILHGDDVQQLVHAGVVQARLALQELDWVVDLLRNDARRLPGPDGGARDDERRPDPGRLEPITHDRGIAPTALVERTVVVGQVRETPARLGVAEYRETFS